MTSSKHNTKDLKRNQDADFEMEQLLAEVEDNDKLPKQPNFDISYDYYKVKKLFASGKNIERYLA